MSNSINIFHTKRLLACKYWSIIKSKRFIFKIFFIIKCKTKLILLFYIVILNIRTQLIQASKSPENINSVVINTDIHSDEKTSAVLTGKAVSAMKNDLEMSNIIKSNTQHFVTNKLIEKKYKETITAKKPVDDMKIMIMKMKIKTVIQTQIVTVTKITMKVMENI